MGKTDEKIQNLIYLEIFYLRMALGSTPPTVQVGEPRAVPVHFTTRIPKLRRARAVSRALVLRPLIRTSVTTPSVPAGSIACWSMTRKRPRDLELGCLEPHRSTTLSRKSRKNLVTRQNLIPCQLCGRQR